MSSSDQPQPAQGPWSYLLHLLVGTALGILFVKGEVVSWFRIQEMFRLQSVHMYATIGSAVAVGALSLRVIKGKGWKALTGETITLDAKERTPWLVRYWLGGIIFGLGWAFTGACPGPMFTLVGTGAPALGVAIASAVAGTWTYALLRDRLPH